AVGRSRVAREDPGRSCACAVRASCWGFVGPERGRAGEVDVTGGFEAVSTWRERCAASGQGGSSLAAVPREKTKAPRHIGREPSATGNDGSSSVRVAGRWVSVVPGPVAGGVATALVVPATVAILVVARGRRRRWRVCRRRVRDRRIHERADDCGRAERGAGDA